MKKLNSNYSTALIVTQRWIERRTQEQTWIKCPCFFNPRTLLIPLQFLASVDLTPRVRRGAGLPPDIFSGVSSILDWMVELLTDLLMSVLLMITVSISVLLLVELRTVLFSDILVSELFSAILVSELFGVSDKPS